MFVDFQTFTARAQRHYSERIAFRPLVLADSWPLWQACQNKLFNLHLLWAQPDRPEVVSERVERMLDEMAAGRLSVLSAVNRDTGEWVAAFRFFHEYDDKPANGLETGIWTHPRFWAGGYSQELSRLALAAAFAETNIDWLKAKTAEENKAAQGMIESVGLKVVAREAVPTEDGNIKHARVYGISREEVVKLNFESWRMPR